MGFQNWQGPWLIFLAVKKKRQHIRERVVGHTFQSSLIVESLSLSGPVGSQPWPHLFLGPVGWPPWPHLFLGPSLVQSAALVSGSSQLAALATLNDELCHPSLAQASQLVTNSGVQDFIVLPKPPGHVLGWPHSPPPPTPTPEVC